MNRHVAALSVLILVVAALVFWTSGVSALEAPKRIEITANRFSYSPIEITLKKGEPVILSLQSVDVAHGLRFRELHLDINARAKGHSEVTFTPDKTGDFIGHCSVFCGSGHGTMVLKLHVVN